MNQQERVKLQTVYDRLIRIASDAPAVAVYRQGVADLGYRTKVEAVAREIKALIGETEQEVEPS